MTATTLEPLRHPYDRIQAVSRGIGHNFQYSLAATNGLTEAEATALAAGAFSEPLLTRQERADMEALALAGGVEDRSYIAPRDGFVPSYAGGGVIEYGGKRWLALGRRPHGGNAWAVAQVGFIRFIALGDDGTKKVSYSRK